MMIMIQYERRLGKKDMTWTDLNGSQLDSRVVLSCRVIVDALANGHGIAWSEISIRSLSLSAVLPPSSTS